MKTPYFYIDANNNYYVDADNSYYIYRIINDTNTRKTLAYVYHNGSFKKAKPIIVKHTNLGPIAENALLTSSGVPFLTNSKQYLLTTDTENITDVGTEDYILIEQLKYTPCIVLS